MDVGSDSSNKDVGDPYEDFSNTTRYETIEITCPKTN